MEMVITEKAKEEAVKRLECLKVHKNVLKEFKKEGVLNKSENMGILYWLDDEEKAIVDWFEKKNKAVAYHVIHQHTDIGELYNILYVILDDSEWEMDHEDLARGHALAYVVNKTMPDCSEFGYIGVKPLIGGVAKTW